MLRLFINTVHVLTDNASYMVFLSLCSVYIIYEVYGTDSQTDSLYSYKNHLGNWTEYIDTQTMQTGSSDNQIKHVDDLTECLNSQQVDRRRKKSDQWYRELDNILNVPRLTI